MSWLEIRRERIRVGEKEITVTRLKKGNIVEILYSPYYKTMRLTFDCGKFVRVGCIDEKTFEMVKKEIDAAIETIVTIKLPPKKEEPKSEPKKKHWWNKGG